MNIHKQISFHEATVTRFCRCDAGLELELEDVLVDGEKLRVVLAISPVSAVVIDGEVSDDLLMAADDGEVLVLEICENNLSLIIEWNDFPHNKSFTRSYYVSGGKVTISVV